MTDTAATGRPAAKPATKAAAKTAVKPAAKNAQAAKPQSKAPAPLKAAGKTVDGAIGLYNLLKIDPVKLDIIADDEIAKEKVRRTLIQMTRQTYVLAALIVVLVAGVPFFQPMYQYYSLTPPDAKTGVMTPLDLPNLTNSAVIKWAASTVTGIMTFGFGDFDVKLGQQKYRFTATGWTAFAKTFVKDKLDVAFRKHQLVLTTVPNDVPVIVKQGLNDDDIYEWTIQMPVVMTYATNNNVTRSKPGTVIELTLVRVPYDRNPFGIAIDSWKQKNP